MGLGALALLGVVVLLLDMERLLLGLGSGVWDGCFVSVNTFILEREVLRDQRDVAHWLADWLLLDHLRLSHLTLFDWCHHTCLVGAMSGRVCITCLRGLGYRSLGRALHMLVEEFFWEFLLLNLSIVHTLE